MNDTGTWQSWFIKDSSEIPTNGFKAFYFEDSTSTITAYSEQVSFPLLNHAYSGPHGIPASRFNAYWIGKFELPDSARWRFDLSQSNSFARLLIDKRVVYSGNESRSLVLGISKGTHVIEIEYKNDWHTVSFSLLYAPVRDETPPVKIDTTVSGVEYWYAGAYESGRADLSLEVVLKKSAKPVILFLSSYEVVRWNVVPADSGQVMAVYVDSYEPKSTVTGLRASVPVTIRQGIPYAYKLLPECQPQMGYCEENLFAKLVGFLGTEFKASLTGFSGAYNPESLAVPEVILDSAKHREIEAQTRALVEASRLRGLGDVFPGDSGATWQKHFIASDADIPKGTFQAFYFSDKDPKNVLHSEQTDSIAVKYSWSSFHSLNAHDFAGYWVGKFEFAAPTVLQFGIQQSHGLTAIHVDKKPVLPNPEAGEGSCSLPAGTHLIEIHHVNNWHTIDFSVSMEPR